MCVGLYKYQEECLDEDELDQEGRACVQEFGPERSTNLWPIDRGISESDVMSSKKVGTESGNLSVNFCDEFGEMQTRDATHSKFAR